MTKIELLKRIQDRQASAKQVRNVLMRALLYAPWPKEKKGELFKRVKSFSDETLLEQASEIAGSYLSFVKLLEKQQKPFKRLIEASIREGMRNFHRIRAVEVSGPTHPNEWLSIIAYLAGIGSEKLRNSLKHSSSSKEYVSICTLELRELLYDIRKNLMTLWIDIKEDFEATVWRILESKESVNGGKVLAARIQDAVAASLKENFHNARKADMRPLSKNELVYLSNFTEKDQFLQILSLYRPEIKKAFDQNPALRQDEEIKNVLAKIEAAIDEIITLPKSVSEKMSKPPSFGAFLCDKLSQC